MVCLVVALVPSEAASFDDTIDTILQARCQGHVLEEVERAGGE